MTLNALRPYNDVCLMEGTTSVATTPVNVTMVAPCSGYIQRVVGAVGGTTSGTITTTVVVNGGSDICGGNFTIAAGTGARAGVIYELALIGAGVTGGVAVNEGDCIVFSPTGGTGNTIQGGFCCVIRSQT